VRSYNECLRGRSMVMEDYATREQLGSLGTMFAVFDGHAGRECSEFLATNFGKYVEVEFRKKFPLDVLMSKKVNVYEKLKCVSAPEKAALDTYLAKIIKTGFLAADQAFLDATEPQDLDSHYVRAGSTGNVCFLRGPSRDQLQLITANVGDSRAVLCRAGKAVRLSEDHKPDRKDETHRIVAAGGSVLDVAGSWRCTKGSGVGITKFRMEDSQVLLATSRAFGDRELKEGDVVIAEPEITVENIGHEDFFVVMGSDGIWDILSDQEACDVAIKHFGDPEAMAKAVAREAIKDDKNHDNSSAVVFMFGWNGDRVKSCLKKQKAAKKQQVKEEVDMFADSD